MSEPSDWVRRHVGLIAAGGRVLDVAAGSGRHVALCRGRGLRVTAVDIDIGGLSRFADDPAVEIVAADLEGAPWPFPTQRFDGVIVVNYLWRPLLPLIVDALAEDGVLIYETFARGNEAFGQPRNPDFLLAPNELLEAVLPALTVLAFEHLIDPPPRPAVRQRIVARRNVDLPRVGC